MKPDFETILDECLSRMCAGQSVEECLAAYPAQAEDLQPLLSVFKEMQTVPEPLERSEAVRTGRQRMLVALDVRESRAPVSFGWFSRYAEQIHQKLRPQEAQTTRSTKEINMKLVLRFALALAAYVGSRPRHPPGQVPRVLRACPRHAVPPQVAEGWHQGRR